MNLPIQLISTDFDGTLFAEFENPPVPAELQQLLAQLQAQGAKWAINTGRDLSGLMEALGRAHLSVKPDYLVLVEREIYTHHDSQYVALAEWNDACTRAHSELFIHVRRDLPRLRAWIEERFPATLYEDIYSPLCLIAEHNDHADIIHAYLNEYCRTVPNLAVMRNDIYARFCHSAYHKGTALTELARRLGVDARQVLAAGDHLNDLPMLRSEHAGCLVAPQNAIPQVKEQVSRLGGYISPHPCGLGVADGIRFHLRLRRENVPFNIASRQK